MPEHVLAVEGLRKVFSVRKPGSRQREELVAVEDVSFAIDRGGALAIVGESGSGKTTVAKMIVGLEEPTAGRITLCGEQASTSKLRAAGRRRRARHVQMVFQDPYSSFNPRQRIEDALLEVLTLHSRLTEAERRQRAAALLDDVGLDQRRGQAVPRVLSGGERQRAAIARALAANPDVLILDEAVAALDVSIQAQIINLLADLRERLQMSYVFLSHDLAVVRQVTDDAIVMQAGRIVEAGRTESLLDAPTDPYTKLLLSSVPGPGWTPRRRRRAAAS